MELVTHSPRSFGYRNIIPQSLAESDSRLLYLRVHDSRDISSKPEPSPSQ